jgi:hypothetical protein
MMTSFYEELHACVQRNHQQRQHYHSYCVNRLVVVRELCDYKNATGKWMPLSVELFELLSRTRQRRCCDLRRRVAVGS